jgi:hypothetical protein
MKKGVDYEINRVLNNKNLRNGSIMLFHNDAKDTPTALPVILRGLIDRGYVIGTVGNLIYKDNYKIDTTGRQFLNAPAPSDRPGSVPETPATQAPAITSAPESRKKA